MTLFGRVLVDGERIDIDGLTVRLRISRRARRVSLRIDGRTGEAVATAPSARRLPDAVAFARARRGWLASRMAARPAPRKLAAGDRIEVFGDTWTLVPDGRRPRLESGRLVGCGAGEVDPQLVARAIRREALEIFRQGCEGHCQTLGAAMPEVAISDPARRWGSCLPPARGRRGRVRLSWRLALAPVGVADYVAAHECCHLVEANHGPRFWALVSNLIGDPSPHRAWLRRHGTALLAFGEPAPG
jgi:predicted metal-dependent hydrolase